jgi:hypothetical protein
LQIRFQLSGIAGTTETDIRSIAIRIRATKINIREIIADRPEIAIHIQEIGNYIAEIAADIQEMPANIEEIRKSGVMKLRNQDMVTKTTEVLNLANVAVTQPNAADRGVTPARVSALSAAIASFSGVMSTPRGQIVNRGSS